MPRHREFLEQSSRRLTHETGIVHHGDEVASALDHLARESRIGTEYADTLAGPVRGVDDVVDHGHDTRRQRVRDLASMVIERSLGPI